MNGKHTTTRRDAIRTAVAATTAVGLAGCSGLLGGSSGLQFGDSIDAELTQDAETDPVYDDLADSYELSLDSETRIQLSMRSSAFDTHLLVTQNGERIAQNDDGGSGLNSNLVTTLDAGTYTVWAGSFSGTGTGQYTLDVSSPDSAATGGSKGGSSDGSDSGSGSTASQTIQLGESVSGRITDDSSRDPVNGGLAVSYQFTLDSETTVRISQESATIDTLLVLTQNGSRVATNDDRGASLNSEIIATLGAGTYTIWAGSFMGEDTGQFTLELAEAEDIGNTTDAQSIDLGSEVSSTLAANAPLDPVNRNPAAPWSFTLDSQTTVRIAMSSGDFDTLFVVTQNGQRVLENDDGGANFNSLATVTLTPGTYTIWAGSWSGSGTGEYRLSLERA